MSRTSNEPSENFAIEVYEADNLINQIVDICDKKGWQYAYVLHNKDKKDDGNPVQNHYAILLRKQNASTRSAIAKNLGIDIRFVQRCESYKAYSVYLIHADEKSRNNPYKHEYGIEEIQGSIAEQIKGIIRNILTRKPCESHKDKEILKFLDWLDTAEYVTMSEVVRWACNNDLISVVQRFASIVRQMIREHNDEIFNQKRIIEIDFEHNGLVVAENKRFAERLKIVTPFEQPALVKKESEEHLVNMAAIKEILNG